MKKIAIILPAYNEEAVITEVIKDLSKEASKRKYHYEIIVVDDCSTDQTIAEVKKTKSKLIKHILNTGSGGSTATGLEYAARNNFDIAATADSDGQHHPKDVLNGIDMMLKKQNVDLLIGSRLIDPAGMSWVKQLGNKGLSLITKMLFRTKVTDTQSGLRIYSKNAINNLRWNANGFEFCSEMIWRAKQKGMTIDEFPIQAIYTDYSVSKGQNNWNAFNIVKSLLRIRILELFGE